MRSSRRAGRASRADKGHTIVVTVLTTRSSGLSSWSALWLIETSELSSVEFPRATSDRAASPVHDEAVDSGAEMLAAGVPYKKASARTAGIKPKNARRNKNAR